MRALPADSLAYLDETAFGKTALPTYPVEGAAEGAGAAAGAGAAVAVQRKGSKQCRNTNGRVTCKHSCVSSC